METKNASELGWRAFLFSFVVTSSLYIILMHKFVLQVVDFHSESVH
jgi:hypothetical protein